MRSTERSPAWRALPIAEIFLYGPDKNTAYTHRPNINGIWTTENRARVSTTSFGIRSNGHKEETIERRSDWFKVGIIGNSITEALQVDDGQTFSALIEKEFQKNGNNIRVYNLGLSGSPPAVEEQRAKYYAEHLDLDLIIIDLPENITHRLGASKGSLMPYYKIGSNGAIVVNRTYLNSRGYKLRQSSLGHALYFLMDHLKIMTVLNNRMNRGLFEELTAQYKAQEKSKPIEKTECNQESLEILANVEQKELFKNNPLLDAFIQDLSQVQNLYNTKIVFALFETWDDCPNALHKNSYASIGTLLDNRGISFLNLREGLIKNLPQGGKLKDLRGFGIKRGDGHLNEIGHNVFSQTLFDYIQPLEQVY